ncbi:PorP/SprF family type IX secretion system membrane protein [Marinilongibacter aquaticus]|uniref:PorP/SprF family type IX secretion system membrane protein n=1 Tax=Marinilongibacter aquaticus TaxID=2975157 RepID=UPI0021BD5B2C|nr:type IX secretion system membrane protein PorP/SprF [Marinilongibacter aquaticus]
MSLSISCVYGQVDPQFTQYVFNSMYLNPGATGIQGKTNITAIYRTQWTGYTGTTDPGGAPNTQQISVSSPFNALGGGLGLYISNDMIGAGSINRELTANYSFHKRFGVNLVGFGVSAGMYSRILDGDKLRPREDEDPSLPSGRVSQSLPDFGAGIFLYNPSYQLGVALKHINQPEYSFSTVSANSPLPRTLNVSGSVLIGLSYTLDLSPMFLIKSDFKTVSPELGALVTYNNSLWAGLNYRYQDAASVILGSNLLNNKLRIGYAMDYVAFGQEAKAPTSHEILLTFFLNPPRAGKKSIIRTPRYRY